MKTSISVCIALLSTTGFFTSGCGTGDTGNRVDGLHGTTRPAPATDLADTGNYRLRNEHNDQQRGDTLRQAQADTAFNKTRNH